MSRPGLAVFVYQRNGEAFIDSYYFEGRVMTHEETTACGLPPVGRKLADREDPLSEGAKDPETIIANLRRLRKCQAKTSRR